MITGEIKFEESTKEWKIFCYMIPSDKTIADKYSIKLHKKVYIASTLDEAVNIYKKVISEYSEDYKYLWGL